jgi:beta-glucosidase
MYLRGVAMGAEFRGKGVNVQLGPFMWVNLPATFLYLSVANRNLMRAPTSGRAWEGYVYKCQIN